MLGVGIGVLLSALSFGIVTIISLGNPSGWTDTPLGMTSPSCIVVLHTRTKSIFPPTEYEYVVTLLSGGKKFDVDIPDDASGGDPVAVHALCATPDNGDSLMVLLFTMPGHAVVVDPKAGRTYAFETYRDYLSIPDNNHFVEQAVGRCEGRPPLERNEIGQHEEL